MATATETTQSAGTSNGGGAVTHLSVAERVRRGTAPRAEVPRASHSAFTPPPGRADPLEVVKSEASRRVPELVPIRYGRMLVSPFTFYRGAAMIMAADLADTPRSGLMAQSCGDAHLSNFGVFASPERQLLFDLNDFDESLPGPWEWDVKRLAASSAVACRENAVKNKRRTAIVRELVEEYRQAIRRFAAMSTLDVWYARASVSDLRELLRSTGSGARGKRFEREIARGRRKD